MKFQDIQHWGEFKESESLLFFAQLLNEMLFDFTLDTYKPNALNVHSLIHEARRISHEIKNEIINEGNFEHIRDELKLSLEKDLALKSVLGIQHKHYIKLIGGTRTHIELSIVLESIHYNLSNKKYFDQLKLVLINNIKEGSSKSNIFSISRALITELLTYGYEKSYIYSLVNKTFFTRVNKVDSLKVLYTFLETFDFKKSEFEVVFICSNEYLNVKKIIEDFDFKVEKTKTKLPLHFLKKKSKNGVFVSAKNIKALDHSSARSTLEKKLQFISDLYSFYNHKGELNIASDSYVIDTNQGIGLNISRLTEAIKKGNDLSPRKVAKTIKLLRENMSLNENSLIRFTKAIQLHRLAIDSKELENQLLDLWAALETLIAKQVNSKKPRIVQIIDFLAPVLSLGYMDKLLCELVKDLELWNKQKTNTILGTIKLDITKNKKLALLISCDKYQDSLDELIEALDNFPLLKNRIGTYSNWCKTDNELHSLLERHYKKVSWQIRRIYRARNTIIHNGNKPKQLEILVENLHAYVDSIIKGVSDMIINEQGESLAQYFIEIKIAYNEHLQYLKKEQKSEINENNFTKIIFGK